jgi:hypothetical protein
VTTPEISGPSDAGIAQTEDNDLALLPVSNSPSSSNIIEPESDFTYRYSSSKLLKGSGSLISGHFVGAPHSSPESLRRPAKRKDLFDLKDRNNPITHSTAIQRSGKIQSPPVVSLWLTMG